MMWLGGGVGTVYPFVSQVADGLDVGALLDGWDAADCRQTPG
jgi:hypothetical protein